MRYAVFLGLLIGIAILVGLVVYHDADRILAMLTTAGFGILLVCLAHLGAVFLNALAWRSLLVGRGVACTPLRAFWLRCVADSINALLPVAHIGGEVVRGQMLARSGAASGSIAGASVIADLTLGLVGLVLFVLTGLFLLTRLGSQDVAVPILFGVTVFTALLGIAYWMQRAGLLVRLAHKLEDHAGGVVWQRMAGGAAALDRELQETYRDRGAVLRCILWRLGAWVGGALEVWVALWVLGQATGVADVLVLESLAQVARNAGFAIPGAIGIQEGSLVVIGGWIGLAAEVALAAGLIKRIRDVLLGVPVLIIWQAQEGRSLWQRRHPATDP